MSISISLNVFSDSLISFMLFIMRQFLSSSTLCAFRIPRPFFYTVSRSKIHLSIKDQLDITALHTRYCISLSADCHFLFFRYIIFRSTNQAPETTLFAALGRLVAIIIAPNCRLLARESLLVFTALCVDGALYMYYILHHILVS